MRHIRARRRFELIVTLLLAACLVIFCEARIEAFVPQFKNFAEASIEEKLNGRVDLSIGAMEGGILHPFVFNDIKIKDKKGVSIFSSIDIDSIKTDYRIWDIFFKRSKGALGSLLSKDSSVYINFVMKDRKVSGFVKLDGDLENSKLKGYVNLANKERVEFSGIVKGDRFDIYITQCGGAIRAKGAVSEAGDLTVDLKINHLKLGGYDITCDANLINRFLIDDNTKKSYLEGELETKNFILNFKPFLDLKASYKVKRTLLDIQNLSLGENIKLSGRAALMQPYNADITIITNNLNLSWLLLNLGASDATSILTGTMNGKFRFEGPLAKSRLTAHMEIRKGTISTLDFDYLTANLKGDLPFVRIEDSRITRESGYFVLAGEMDLRKMGKESLFDGIKITSDDKAITWDGWNAAKVQNVQEVSMEKKLSEDISIDFKKFISNEKVDESLRDTDEVHLEYKLHPHESLKMMVGQDKDFLGIEHKDKF